MKLIVTLFALISFVSCQQSNINYTEVILEDTIINSEFLQAINSPEKALLMANLYAYGNECVSSSTSAKCKILKELGVENECDEQHINFLKKWFKKVFLMKHKLQNCPNLPHTFAIQNSFDKIVMRRNSDTISITIRVKGINKSQEKSWDHEQTDTYLIKDETLIKI